MDPRNGLRGVGLPFDFCVLKPSFQNPTSAAMLTNIIVIQHCQEVYVYQCNTMHGTAADVGF